MRVVLDTNILVSALLVQLGHSAAIYRGWHEGHFTLLTCTEQIDELRATLRKPTIAARIKPHSAGRLVNALKDLAIRARFRRITRMSIPKASICTVEKN
jgi:predicted nucleic acid-binding protein